MEKKYYDSIDWDFPPETPVLDLDFEEERYVEETSIKCDLFEKQSPYSICDIAREFSRLFKNE